MTKDNQQPPPSPAVYVNIKQPDPFSFVASQWPAYRKLLERYAKYSSMASLSLAAQKELILMIMGSEADDAYLQFQNNLTEATSTVEELLQQFDLYFKPQVNAVFERGRFFDMKQLPGQTNSYFIKEVYKQAQKCEFAACKEEMIRDKLCHGISDRAVAAKLREDSTLTLASVLIRLKSLDNMKEELSGELQTQEVQSQLQQNVVSHPVSVNAINRRPNPPKALKKEHNQVKSSSSPPPQPLSPCENCGYYREHPVEECFARDEVCCYCKKKGHFSKRCKNKNAVVNTINYDPSPEQEDSSDSDFIIDSVYLSAVSSSSVASNAWHVPVRLADNFKTTTMKVDSGADVTAISRSTYNKIRVKPPIIPTQSRIRTSSGANLSVAGFIRTTVAVAGKKLCTKVFIIDNLKENLLSRSASLKLGVIDFHPPEAPEKPVVPTPHKPTAKIQEISTTPVSSPPPQHTFNNSWPLLNLGKGEGRCILLIDFDRQTAQVFQLEESSSKSEQTGIKVKAN